VQIFFSRLFGQQDVDLRPPRSGSWSQVKEPLISAKGERRLPSIPRLRKSSDEDDIREILQQQNRDRPPVPVSPANSVASDRSSCDPLGRPLLYNKLPGNISVDCYV
jgi:hypothetical protein